MKKAILVLAILFITTSVNAEILYNVIDLGTLGGDRSEARSINNNGQIVGSAWTNSDSKRACLFDPTGKSNNIDLGTLGGNESTGFSINNNGQIVGGATDNLGRLNACLFGGNNISLGPFNSSDNSEAQSINNTGQIVGRRNWSASLFDSSGSIQPTSLGGNGSVACSISDDGKIVGFSRAGSSSQHACLFDPTGTGDNIDLDKLSEESMPSGAWSINNSSQIAGYYSDFSEYIGYSHACLFDPTGTGNIIDLGTLDGNGSNGSVAHSINEIGQVVGTARTGSGEWHAALFDSTGSGDNIDLNTLIDSLSGWTLKSALDINDYGQIVGYGINPFGYEHAFLLTPIPEPTTLMLLGLGGVLIRKHK